VYGNKWPYLVLPWILYLFNPVNRVVVVVVVVVIVMTTEWGSCCCFYDKELSYAEFFRSYIDRIVKLIPGGNK